MLKHFFLAILVLLAIQDFLCRAAFADQQIPVELQGIGIDDKTGQSVNLDIPFADSEGKPVVLKDYFGKKPVLLALVYYGCPNLCTLVLNSTLDTLKDVNLVAGKDFDVLAVSFDPRENAELAKNKKSAYVAEYKKTKPTASEDGFHFLTGSKASIENVTSQMGFKFRWDKDSNQYAHASAVFVLTPGGKVSRVFYGLMYPPRDMRLALVEAGEGKIGNIVDQFMLFCFHYDAAAQKYVLLAQNLMKLGGAIMLAVLAFFMAVFWRKEIQLTRKTRKQHPEEVNNVI